MIAPGPSPAEDDDPFSLLKEAIVFKNAGRFGDCNSRLDAFLARLPDNAHGHHELALSMRYQGRQHASLTHARRASVLDPERHEYALTLVEQLAITGHHAEAAATLDRHRARTSRHRREALATAQFVRFLERFPREKIDAALHRLSAGGRFLDLARVTAVLRDRIAKRASFSLVRLGDGEGAWTFLSHGDEASHSDLYRSARLSFLADWYGSTDLIEDDRFQAFADDLHSATDQCNLVGITDLARVEHEYRLVSQRGIPTSVNVLRKLHVVDGSCDADKFFCSNNIHHMLAHDGFFDQLFASGQKLLLISSYPNLAAKLRDRGADVVRSFDNPGDSRNFWRADGGAPLRQWPEIYEAIRADLAKADLRGVVALVAAGFVGKQYVPAIQRQGGIAIDIGGVADRWGKG